MAPTLKYYTPRPSDKSSHKKMVRVWDPDAEKDRIVYFGAPDYQDYTQHRDKARRRNYLKRSYGIRGGYGRDDPRSANYWSRRVLWASDRPLDPELATKYQSDEWCFFAPPNVAKSSIATPRGGRPKWA